MTQKDTKARISKLRYDAKLLDWEMGGLPWGPAKAEMTRRQIALLDEAKALEAPFLAKAKAQKEKKRAEQASMMAKARDAKKAKEEEDAKRFALEMEEAKKKYGYVGTWGTAFAIAGGRLGVGMRTMADEALAERKQKKREEKEAAKMNRVLGLK